VAGAAAVPDFQQQAGGKVSFAAATSNSSIENLGRNVLVHVQVAIAKNQLFFFV
jgi:hypothetical protein